MKINFYKQKKQLDLEYKPIIWNDNSGFDEKELKEGADRLLRDHFGLSHTLLRARLFEYLCDNARISICEHGIFADKINHADILKDTCKKWRIDKTEQEMPAMYDKIKRAVATGAYLAFPDFGHTVPDYENLMKYGLSGLKSRAEEAKSQAAAKGLLTPQMRDFYDSVIVCYQAAIRLMERNKKEAERLGMNDLAECLQNLTTSAPKSLYEAMELNCFYFSIHEMGLEKARTLGQLDRIFYPFYKKEIISGTDIEEIKELIRFYLYKFFAVNIDSNQPCSLGGVYADGSPVENELTGLFLSITDELDINSPKILFRVRKDLDDKWITRILKMMRKGHNSIVLINDETVYRAFERIGIERKHSLAYLPQGCYEPTLAGLEEPMICDAWINISKAVEYALTGGRDLITDELAGEPIAIHFESYEDFIKTFYIQLGTMLDTVMEYIKAIAPFHSYVNPSPLYSGTITSCMEKGQDIFDGGAVYNNSSIKCCCIGSAVDSLLSIKRLVFDEKICTLDELVSILKNDWKDAEVLRADILHDKNKYGNNLPEPDLLAKEIYDFIAHRVIGKNNNRGGVFRLGADSVMHYSILGKRAGATPDGRKAREPLSKNLLCSTGMDRRGITALLQSVTKIDHSYFTDGAVFDFQFHKTAVEGDEGLEAMRSVINAYFERGGLAIQGNVFDPAILRDAQINPDKYHNLQVRICGWNVYYVDLSKQEQDEYIIRAGE